MGITCSHYYFGMKLTVDSVSTLSYIYIYMCVCVCVCVCLHHHHHHYVTPWSPWPFLATLLYHPLLPEVFKATCCISTKLLYVGSSGSFCLWSSIWSGLQEYVTYEFVPTSPAVSRISGSSNLDNFRDGS